MKRRVRRLYLDLGVGAGVLTIDGGKRLVGVDDPNATTVFLTCRIRLTFPELVDARIEFVTEKIQLSFDCIGRLTWCHSKE